MGCDLILALDVPDQAAASHILGQVEGQVRWVKIGLQMFTAHGPDWVRRVAGRGFNVFLDLKLHDIPHTVAKAVEALSPLPIHMLTLHAGGGGEMLRAAQKAARPDLWLLGVTVLTSMDDAGLAEIGVGGGAERQVARLAQVAIDAGLAGLVCSPREIATVRALSPSIKIVTPGIRPAAPSAAGAPAADRRAGDDQKRTLSAEEAARAGADFLVIGRPILEAPDPGQAARSLLASLAR